MAALITHKLKTRLAVVCWMISACRSAVETPAQVKPAEPATVAASESERPDTEAGELPRGVSAPAPGPQDARETRDGLQTVALADAPRAATRGASPAASAKQPVETNAPTARPVAAAEANAPSARPAAPAERSAPSAKPAAAAKPAAPAERSAPSAKPAAAAKPAASAEPPAPSAKPAAAPKPAASKPAATKSPAQAPRPAQTVQPPPVQEEPIAPPPPPPAAKASVLVPRTDHVHVDVPAGLQHWLDEDDRMKPWLGKAINVADACYAKVREDDGGAAGVISLAITMHENARPSGRVSSVSGPINSIVMCATTRLLGVKMPLFTGNEGDTYTVRVHFDP